jgi:uncharacterized membrane protein YfcA
MTDLSGWAHLACAASAIGAGFVNAVAGGGTLISFPTMTALGVPSVAANATNTVALCPGYAGGAIAQRADLHGVGPSLHRQLVVSAVGGLVGSVLLVLSSEGLFRSVVPFLVLSASVLLAVQVRLRAWLFGGDHARKTRPMAELAAIAAASIYGGYFGAGLGIMLLAVIGLFNDYPLSRVNATKQLLSIVVNLCAAAFLVVSGKVEWTLVAVMAPGALVGGSLGGQWASRLPADRLRTLVVAYGVVVAVVYFLR